MLSSLSAIMTADGLFGQLRTFEGVFTPWDGQETTFASLQQGEPNHVASTKPTNETVLSNSGSENLLTPIPVASNSIGSGADEPNRNISNSNSGSEDPNLGVSMIDQRKRRRMISNRESARRSRIRKQKHLENLRNLVDRLRMGNRELTNRLHFVAHHCQIVRRDNDRLRSESVILKQKLWDIHQVLLVRQLQHQLSSTAWPGNTSVMSTHQQITQPLIT